MLHKVLSEDADDDAAAAPFSEVTLDNAELAKIRYLGGWAISKVRNAAQRYVFKKNCFSSSTDFNIHFASSSFSSRCIQVGCVSFLFRFSPVV